MSWHLFRVFSISECDIGSTVSCLFTYRHPAKEMPIRLFYSILAMADLPTQLTFVMARQSVTLSMLMPAYVFNKIGLWLHCSSVTVGRRPFIYGSFCRSFGRICWKILEIEKFTNRCHGNWKKPFYFKTNLAVYIRPSKTSSYGWHLPAWRKLAKSTMAYWKTNFLVFALFRSKFILLHWSGSQADIWLPGACRLAGNLN